MLYVIIFKKVVIIQSVYSAYAVIFYLRTTLLWPIPIPSNQPPRFVVYILFPVANLGIEVCVACSGGKIYIRNSVTNSNGK